MKWAELILQALSPHLRHSSFWFSKLSVTSPTSQPILQPFHRFTYVTTHSPTFPLLQLRHSSFSNPSFASPTSQNFHLRHVARRPCSASIFDVPYWPPYRSDKFISCVVPGPSQWFSVFGEEVNRMESYQVSKVDVPESPTVNGAWGPWQQRCDSLHCHEEWWSSLPPSVVVFSWVLATTISPPKRKNHC